MNIRPHHLSIQRVLVALTALWATAIYGDSFEKDAQVRLTKDAPIYFRDQVIRQAKEGETFRVIQTNPATKRVFVFATDIDGKPVAYNLDQDALALVPGAAQPPPVAEAKSNAKSIAGLEAFYRINNRKPESYSIGAPRLEKGTFYIIGNRVQQYEGGAVLTFSEGRLTDEQVSHVVPGRKGLSGVLTFKNPAAMEGVQLSRGELIIAVGKLIEFRDVPMVDGSSEHLPVFEVVGFKTERAFFNTE